MVTPTGAAMRTSRIYFPSSANPPARSFPFARPPSAPQNTAQGGYRISSRNSSSSSAATASRASDAPDARLPFSLKRPAGQPGHVSCPCALRVDMSLLAEQLRLSTSRDIPRCSLRHQASAHQKTHSHTVNPKPHHRAIHVDPANLSAAHMCSSVSRKMVSQTTRSHCIPSTQLQHTSLRLRK